MSLKSINESFERQFNEVNDSLHKEFKILESLRALLYRLDEAEMSDEDRRESDLIRSAYAKIQKRSNARLTPEEQAVLDKYGIVRDYDKKLHYKSENPRNRDNTSIVDNPEDDFSHGEKVGSYIRPRKPDGSKDYSKDGYYLRTKDQDKINYADRARKRPERAKNRSYDYTQFHDYYNGGASYDDSGLIDYNFNDDNQYNWWDAPPSRGVSQNTAISRMSQSNMNKMRGALATRKDAQKDLDTAQDTFNRRKADADTSYMKKMQDAERDYDSRMSYAKQVFDRESNPARRDKAQADIDALLKRKKTEAVDLSDKKGSITNLLINDKSWKNASTPKELANIVKKMLDDNNINTKKSQELVKKLSQKKNMVDASFYIYNFIQAGSGEPAMK